MQNKTSDTEEFRSTLTRIGSFMAYEISYLLDTENVFFETNFGKIKGLRLLDENVIFISILRAAIPMVNGALKIFPRSRIGVVSARRLMIKEGTDKKMVELTVPIEYSNIPKITKDSIVIIPDPALATGTTVVTVLKNILNNVLPERIIILSVICTKIGVNNILNNYPKAEIFTAHVGKGLNNMGYISPDGLGDAGDRSFGLGSTIHSIK